MPLEPHELYEKVKRYDTGRWAPPPRLIGTQYATVEKKRNSSQKNEQAGPKLKWCSVVDVSGGESKVWCYKEQYYTGTQNIRSMNQGKLDMVKHETARRKRKEWILTF